MLRWVESWGMSPNVADYVTYERLLSVSSQFSIGPGAYGDPCLINYGQYNSSITTRAIPAGPFSTLGHSFRIYPPPGGNGPAAITLNALDLANNVTHCWVGFNGTNGVVTIGNASGTLFTSGLGQFPINARFWGEVKFVIGSGVSGAVYVNLPNTTISLTGINTQNGARGFCDTTRWAAPAGIPTPFQLQHMCWWDTTGSYNNTWLGDRRVFAGAINANGDTDQFAPTGLASNYLNVANCPPNATDYNVSGTVGSVDLYKGSSPTGITGVAGVMVTAITEKDDSGTRSFATQLKSGGTLVSGASVVMTSSYTLNNADIWEADPSTAVPFTPAALPLLQYGGKVAA